METNPFSLSPFNGQQEKAFSDYPIILVDLPGHGKSVSTPWISLMDTTDLIAREVLKNRAVHVVGISLGGHVALELAKRYPEKIPSAFISGITATPMHFQFFLKLQSRIVQRGIHNDRYLYKFDSWRPTCLAGAKSAGI